MIKGGMDGDSTLNLDVFMAIHDLIRATPWGQGRAMKIVAV